MTSYEEKIMKETIQKKELELHKKMCSKPGCNNLKSAYSPYCLNCHLKHVKEQRRVI